MRWRHGQDAPDVIDQRAGGGGGGRLPLRIPGGAAGRGAGGLGLIGVLVFLAIQLLGGSGGGRPARVYLDLSFYRDMEQQLGAPGDFAWAYVIEEGDVEEAMTASEAVGDDRLQRRSTGRIDPDSFTHGTSAHALDEGRR